MLRLTLVAALIGIATCSLCPDGFELVRNGQCHKEVEDAKYDNSNMEPEDAKKECKQLNAQTVIIRNQEDNDYWASVARANHEKGVNSGYIFLGLECNKLARWQWEDGTKITYKPEGYNPDLDDFCDNTNDSWAWKCMWAIHPETNEWKEMCFTKAHVDVYCVFTPTYDHVDNDKDCSNFSHDDDDDVCYQVGKTPETFSDAKSMCYGFGATLASIHNDRENSFIRRLAVSKNLVGALMIGATANKENSYDWADGTSFDYQHFAPGFPNSASGDCLAMQTNETSGQWRNVDCSEKHPFACVRPTGYKMPECGSVYKEGDIIYSPGFPSASSEPCDYILQVDSGKLVEVEILFLEANSCCDHLVLTEGTQGGTEIANLSGELENGKKFRTTSQNVMRASWEPQGGVNVRGMMITFRGVSK